MMLQIDQRGDFYSAVGQAKYIEPSSFLQDNSGSERSTCLGQLALRHTSRYTS